MTHPFDIAAVATIDDALDIVRKLRSKFTMVGVEFVPQDIRDNVTDFDEIQEIEDADERRDKIEELVRVTLEDRRWYGLDDSLAELGNEIINEILTDRL